MAAINATLTFSQSTPAAVNVSGATFTEIKANALAALAAQRNAPAAALTAIDAATAALQA